MYNEMRSLEPFATWSGKNIMWVDLSNGQVKELGMTEENIRARTIGIIGTKAIIEQRAAKERGQIETIILPGNIILEIIIDQQIAVSKRIHDR